MELKSILPLKLFEVVDRAGISTSKQILVLSVWDIKKLTNLRTDDVALLKTLVAGHVSPTVVTCDTLLDKVNFKVKAGSDGIDKLLRGGFRRGTITEVYGESGSGKTQVALQAAAHNWESGSVFLCTEDQFPVKRFEQMRARTTDCSFSKDYGKNTFVEHITEASDLLSCVRVRLPRLLENNKLSLIVVDSVAASFRSEYTNYVQRAEELRELAMDLIELAQKHNVAVLCINQVTAAFDGTGSVSPALGLAWSNLVSTRLWLKKTCNNIMDMRKLPSFTSSAVTNMERTVHIRELSIIFSPDLPLSSVKFIITSNGIQCLEY